VGNSVVCYVYYYKWKATTAKCFIVCLAMLDLTTSVVCIPMELAMLRQPYLFDSTVVCKLERFARSTTIVAAGFTLTAIAVDRYMKICRPTDVPITVGVAKKTCVVVILIGVLFSWPAFILFGVNDKKDFVMAETSCSTSSRYQTTAYPIVYYGLLFVLYIGTGICLVVLYGFVGAKVSTHRKKRVSRKLFWNKPVSDIQHTTSSQTESEVQVKCKEYHAHEQVNTLPIIRRAVPLANQIPPNNNFNKRPGHEQMNTLPNIRRTLSYQIPANDNVKTRAQSLTSLFTMSLRRRKPANIHKHKTTIMLILITAVYYCSIVPYLGAMVVRFVVPGFGSTMGAGAQVMYNLCLLSHFISSAINPFIYGFCSQHFRNEFTRLVRRMRSTVCKYCGRGQATTGLF
jgi:hypothetical protein